MWDLFQYFVCDGMYVFVRENRLGLPEKPFHDAHVI